MKIKVESCWSGNSNFCFRVTSKAGYFRIPAKEGRWTRKVAKDILNYLENMGFRRRNIRFIHV